MSGHKCCFHSLVIPGIMGCCGCDASLMPGITWEIAEKTHGFSESRAAQMRANALFNLGRVMEGAKALTGDPEPAPAGPRHTALITPPSINGR